MRGQLQSIIVVVVAVSMLPTFCRAGSEEFRIGMANSFFTGRPKAVVDIISRDFGNVMKKTTGLGGRLDTVHKQYELGQALKDRKLDFGVFHGHEFASVRKRFPDLQPLLIAGNKLEERAYLIVHRDSKARSTGDLGGKSVNLPVDARGHCRVFLDKLAADHGKRRDKFFGSIVNSTSQTEALDELARGKVEAAIVDSIGLTFYKEVRGPVFEKNLRVLLESGAFPPPVIVYYRGALDEKVVTRFRDGLLKVPTTELGRQHLKEWNIDSYDPVPMDYERKLDEVLKAYPLSQR